MCGIAGVMAGPGQTPDQRVLDALTAALAHRGPDAQGRFQQGAVALVHTRLSIIDLTTGDQPLFGTGGATLVANGEIYNDRDLRHELADYPFRTGSDCEPALALYERDGVDFALALRGMYALALFDPRAQRLLLARDPFGIKPLYYVERNGLFAFASEAQALIRAGLAAADVDPRRRAELLQLKFTTGADTIFPGIHRVLPGETLVVEAGRIVEWRRRAALPARGPDNHGGLEDFDRVFADSVERHLRADVPFGLFLSGGVDSAAVLAMMKRVSRTPTYALTVGYEGVFAKDESAEAIRLAKAIGADHHMVTFGEEDFWTLAPKVAEALDDPTADAAALPTFKLAAAARGTLKVVLCGEGGDEVFAGYHRYRRGCRPWWLLGRQPRQSGAFKRVRLEPGVLDAWRQGISAAEALSVPGWSRLQTLQAVDCAEWLPNDLLTKLDRCLMRHGVEGRTPFVDPVVADFAFRLPDGRKIRAGKGKWLLRAWLAEAFPEARAFARKLGFNVPTGRWLTLRQDRLAPLLAAHPAIGPLCPPTTVRGILAEAERHAQPAWSLLFYALWHSRHILGQTSDGDTFAVLAEAAKGN